MLLMANLTIHLVIPLPKNQLIRNFSLLQLVILIEVLVMILNLQCLRWLLHLLVPLFKILKEPRLNLTAHSEFFLPQKVHFNQ